jgi:hypothetical protein
MLEAAADFIRIHMTLLSLTRKAHPLSQISVLNEPFLSRMESAPSPGNVLRRRRCTAMASIASVPLLSDSSTPVKNDLAQRLKDVNTWTRETISTTNLVLKQQTHPEGSLIKRQ